MTIISYNAATTLSMPNRLFFDWDNTLIHSCDGIFIALEQTFVAMKMTPLTRTAFSARPPRSIRESFPEIFGHDKWMEAYEYYTQYSEDCHLEHLDKADGVESLIAVLATLPIFRAVVSNKTGGTLRKELAHLKWTPYFDKIVGSGDAARDKPATDLVQYAVGDATFKGNHDDWFVGDSPVDVACALATGCRPILVGNLHPSFEGQSFAEDILHFKNCHALADCLEALSATMPWSKPVATHNAA